MKRQQEKNSVVMTAPQRNPRNPRKKLRGSKYEWYLWIESREFQVVFVEGLGSRSLGKGNLRIWKRKEMKRLHC